MNVAAIDIGANSVHLVVSRLYAPGTRQVLDRAKEMLLLGRSVFRTGRIPPLEMGRAIAVLKRFRAIAESHAAEAVLAVATSAVREARNRSAFVRRAEKEARLAVRVLSGEEEGRLIYAGVRDGILPTLGRMAVIDVGGGSVEVVVGEGDKVRRARCLKLGVLRLGALVGGGRNGRDPEDFGERLGKRLREEIRPAAREVREADPEAVLGTSGTILSLAALLGVRENGRPIRLGELSRLEERLLAAPRREVRDLTPVGEGRADTIGPGAVLLRTFMEEAGLKEIWPCDRALREGVVADYATRNAGRLERPVDDENDPRRRSVFHFARRLGALDLHALQTSSLARRIFDDLSGLHRLGPKDRELLEFAAILHDAGYWISSDGHHKHVYYLIQHGPLDGFTAEERSLLALLARYHRGAEPRKRHEGFAELRPENRRRIRRLAAILRVADALDRSHAGLVKEIRAIEGRSTVTIELAAQGEPELELYAAEARAGLFEREFGKALRFRRIRASARPD